MQQHQIIEKNHGIVVLTVVLLVLSWIALVLRLIVRGAILRILGWDDATLVLTAIVFTALCSVTASAAQLEILSGPLDPIVVLMLVTDLFAGFTLYIIATIISKISLGLFFLRFLVTTWQRWLVIVSITIFTIYSVAFLVAVYCTFGRPGHLTDDILNDTCAGSSCGSWHVIGPLTYTGAALNSLIDVVFAVLPVLFIHDTALPRRAKISICVLLGLGLISGIASTVRIPYISGLDLNNTIYPSPKYISASIVELAAAILTLSCAALRPLFSRHSRHERLGSQDAHPNALMVEDGTNQQIITTTTVSVSSSAASSPKKSEFVIGGFEGRYAEKDGAPEPDMAEYDAREMDVEQGPPGRGLPRHD